MKVCKYCNSLANDSALECSNCGASDFGYKCENCGKVSSKRFCTSCGMKIGPRVEICPTCGTQFLTPTCPCCGYPNVREDYNSGGKEQDKTEKKLSAGTILAWIFFLQIMLLITVWKSKKLDTGWKVLITFLVLFIQALPSIFSSGLESARSAAEPTSIVVSSAPHENKDAGITNKIAYDIRYQNASAYETQTGDVFIQGIVEIVNTGPTNLEINSGEMDFEDEKGSILATRKAVNAYPNILLPGEKGYLYCRLQYNNTMPATINMIVRPDINETDSQCVRFTVTEVEIKNTYYNSIKILGRMENTTGIDQGFIDLAAILFDDNGLPIAVLNNFFSEEFKPGDKIGFELESAYLPDDITAETVSSVLVFACPMLSIESLR